MENLWTCKYKGGRCMEPTIKVGRLMITVGDLLFGIPLYTEEAKKIIKWMSLTGTPPTYHFMNELFQSSTGGWSGVCIKRNEKH